jgi:hypothetical protein
MLTLLVQYTGPRVTMRRFTVKNKHLLWQFDIKKTTHCDNLLHRRYLVPKIIPYVIYCVCLLVCLMDMVVGFTAAYAISAYHRWCCEFESRTGRGVQHYVIKFVKLPCRSSSDPHTTLQQKSWGETRWSWR